MSVYSGMHLLLRMCDCYQCVQWNAFACTHVWLLSGCTVECICLYACVIVISVYSGMHLLVHMCYCYQCVQWNAFACTHVLLLSGCTVECICLYACVIVIIWVDAWSDVIVTFVTVYMDWCMKWCHCKLCDCVYGLMHEVMPL